MKSETQSEPFVPMKSIVRKIWGHSDTILMIFAASAAEFALNKAVDWLYFTGKLPADPIGRLFSTVEYARRIVFSPKEKAYQVIDGISHIHHTIEENRKSKIPDWAYRDVLYMLIDYSIRSYELLERKLNAEEKTAVYDVFYEMGTRMHLKELPTSYSDWLISRDYHLKHDLEYSGYTKDLFIQYKKHLGKLRYYILRLGQTLILPNEIKKSLPINTFISLKPLLILYKAAKYFHADHLLKKAILPPKYYKQIMALDNP